MILELHILQSFPVSNLNRDDAGQPKTATFGGVTRARVSSQSWKRAARRLMPSFGLGEDRLGTRTKRLRSAAAATMPGGATEENLRVAETALHELGFPMEPNGLTSYLLFVGQPAVAALAEYCEQHRARLETAATGPKSPVGTKKKGDSKLLAKALELLDGARAADIALFGRMIADNKDFNVDAASQVAHAISTHAVTNEFDYYTAIDDLLPTDQSGADMIGTVDFNSAVYYRYVNLDLTQLAENLAHDADLVERATMAWLQAFIHAVPGGKQTSMAARTPPSTLIGVAREHGAWNLANAFLKPVTGADVIAESTDRLTTHFAQLRSFYGDGNLRAVAGAVLGGDLPQLPAEEVVATCDAFVDRLASAVTAP